MPTRVSITQTNRKNHQNSERMAQPWKSAYFCVTQVSTASWICMGALSDVSWLRIARHRSRDGRRCERVGRTARPRRLADRAASAAAAQERILLPAPRPAAAISAISAIDAVEAAEDLAGTVGGGK